MDRRLRVSTWASPHPPLGEASPSEEYPLWKLPYHDQPPIIIACLYAVLSLQPLELGELDEGERVTKKFGRTVSTFQSSPCDAPPDVFTICVSYVLVVCSGRPLS
jgi:hypothetical protein